MTRAERRRVERDKSKTATYNLTKEQLDSYVREYATKLFEESREEMMDEAVNNAMLLLLTLPMEVLINHFWEKSYRKRIPEFTEFVLDYYRRWQDGELDMDEMTEHLWEYGGVRLERSEADEKA